MAEHEIFLTVPKYEVQNADVEFEIRSNGTLLGRLFVSRGDLEWRLPNEQRGHAIDWEDFSEVMAKRPQRP